MGSGRLARDAPLPERASSLSCARFENREGGSMKQIAAKRIAYQGRGIADRIMLSGLVMCLLLVCPSLAHADDAASDGVSLVRTLVVLLAAGMGGVGWQLIRDAARTFVEGRRQLPNPAISQELRTSVAEAIRIARIAAGGPTGPCEAAKLSLLEQLGSRVRGVEDLIGRGASAFQHEFVVLKETGHVLDPVARQAVERRLVSWAELEARGLRGAVQEGIFTAEQWQAFKSLETTRAGERAARRATVGRVLIGVGLLLSVATIATAPEGQRGITAAMEAGAWAGAFAFGELGAWFGAMVGGPPGALIGGLLGALIGAFVGSSTAESLWERIFGAPEDKRVGALPALIVGCDCMGISAGLLTGGWRDQCMSEEAAIVKLAGTARTAAEAAERLGLTADAAGKINGGQVCFMHGDLAWPIHGAPIAGPAGPVRRGGKACNPTGLSQQCEGE
jgi:hypothetical protein